MSRVFAAAAAALACLLVPAVTTASAQVPSPQTIVSGNVADPSGAPIEGATVTALLRGRALASTSTDARGSFTLSIPAREPFHLTITAAGFVQRRVGLTPATASGRTFVLPIAGVYEAVNVDAIGGYRSGDMRTATRTPTALVNVPQSISIVTQELIADQAMLGIGDVVRYMPGVGIAQGEGNRDTPILRGQATTADFFVDGIKDDVQYLRDLYNVERVEAIKGANAMIFGRGGAGGVINRVTRVADWASRAALGVHTGSWNHRRVTGDYGTAVSDAAAVRVTGVFEDSDSYRSGVGVRRYGANPNVAFRLAPRTLLRAGYEYFHDERTADRGVSSLNGRPLETDPAQFFGDAGRSPVRATINVATLTLDHGFAGASYIRSRTSFGDYDKFYQNVFPGAVNAAAGTVQISGYNNATARRNLFHQTDVVMPVRTGSIGHVLMVGTELGRQATENYRATAFFTSRGPSVTSVSAPLSNPTIDLPIEFRQNATDADNHGVATTAAVYVQDQIALAARLHAVVGMRFDRLDVDFTNNRNGQNIDSTDALWSPRAGVIYKPRADASLYAAYSLSYVPRAGEQLASLTVSNRSLEPETFRNYEIGAKWDASGSLALTAAAYRLDRGNVAVADPADPTRSILVDAQRAHGLELGLNGSLTRAWTVAGGYAYQNGKITRSIAANAQAGASLAQLPRHSFSLWNRYQAARRLSFGLGVIHRGESFTSTDNLVVLPAFTRADAAVYFDVSPKLRAQLNVENVFDTRYFSSAHSNTNITPGSPRAIRLGLTVRP